MRKLNLSPQSFLLRLLLGWFMLNFYGIFMWAFLTPSLPVTYTYSKEFPYMSYPDYLRGFIYILSGREWLYEAIDRWSIMPGPYGFFAIITVIQAAITSVAIWLWWRKPTLVRATGLAIAGVVGGPYITMLFGRFTGFAGVYYLQWMLVFLVSLILLNYLRKKYSGALPSHTSYL